ncbi:MAG: hypothetical protein V4537_14615 [Pseudomonadota bacterium]
MLRAILRQPNKADGTQGDPWDIASCDILVAPKDQAEAGISAAMTVLDQDATPGGVEWDYTGLDRSVARDFDFRFKGTTTGGKKFSVPNDGWYSLQVTADPT